MVKNFRGMAILAAAAVCAVPLVAHAAGLWSTLPGIGGSAFCASTVSGVQLPTNQGPYGVLPGSTQGTGQGLCAQTVPAGPTTFAGTEYLPVDVYQQGTSAMAAGPSTVVVSLLQLGQGPMLDVTAPATATIPNGTPFYFLDGAQAAAFTITMPAVASEGQIQRIVCEAATAGTLTVAANTGQTLKGNPAAACVAGTTYNFRYQASNTTWYRW